MEAERIVMQKWINLILQFLAGDNPANCLANPKAYLTPVRIRATVALIKGIMFFQGDLKETYIAARRWAAIETLNRGSYQRATFPLELEDFPGSGRWFANDGGGSWKRLREILMFPKFDFPIEVIIGGWAPDEFDWSDIDPETSLSWLMETLQNALPDALEKERDEALEALRLLVVHSWYDEEKQREMYSRCPGKYAYALRSLRRLGYPESVDKFDRASLEKAIEFLKV